MVVVVASKVLRAATITARVEPQLIQAQAAIAKIPAHPTTNRINNKLQQLQQGSLYLVVCLELSSRISLALAATGEE